MRAYLLLVLATLSTSACVGSVEDDGGGDGAVVPDGGGTAKQGPAIYARDVHPILARCGSSGCHASTAVSSALGKYYSADASASYTALTGLQVEIGTFTSSAPLLTKIAATPPHNGMTYTTDEVGKLTAWLSTEATERMGTTPIPPTTDPVQALKNWSGCMTIADFQTANMAIAWGTMAGTNPNKSCINCHGGGLDGFIATTDETVFFTGISTQLDLIKPYFSVDGTGKVVINTGSFERVGAADSSVTNHPHFNTTTNQGMTALTQFYSLVLAHQTGGTCGPPTIL